MAAVLGLDDDKVELACNRTDGDVWVANYNAPGQVVIAGSVDAVAEAGSSSKKMSVVPTKHASPNGSRKTGRPSSASA